MLDDLRKDHDPRPNAEERDWLAGDFYGQLSKALCLIGFAAMVGLGASAMLDLYTSVPAVAAADSPRASSGASTRAE